MAELTPAHIIVRLVRCSTKKNSLSGNRTLVYRVTGGDTNHYTNRDYETVALALRHCDVRYDGLDVLKYHILISVGSIMGFQNYPKCAGVSTHRSRSVGPS